MCWRNGFAGGLLFAVVAVLLICAASCVRKKSAHRVSGVTDEGVRAVTRQASRWLIAAEQDRSPLIAAMHAQYGMGHLWALKKLTTPEQFRRVTGHDLARFEAEALRIQDRTTVQAVQACPAFAGDVSAFLAQLAGKLAA